MRRWARELQEMCAAAFSGNGCAKTDKDYEILKSGKRVERLEPGNELPEKILCVYLFVGRLDVGK